MEKTFSHIEVVPGDTTWLLVSDSSGFEGDPGILVKRFASNREAASFFPPEGLLSLYIPDRAEAAIEKYRSVNILGTSLLNTDANPPAYLFGLLLSVRQSGIGLTSFIEKLLGSGMIYPLMPVALFLLLLSVYILGKLGERKAMGRILSIWVIFAAGFVSIGTVIALMYLFQTCLGSLYLNVGVVSAIFMLGLSVGATLGRQLFDGIKKESGFLLDFAVTIHVAVLFLILYLPISEWRYGYFILAFSLSGTCSGFYFPAAAFFLRESACDELDSGGMLETSDHIGAALGAFICGVLVIPVWGVAGTLIFFIIVMLTVIPVSLLYRHGSVYAGNDDAVLKYRRSVYFMLLVLILLLVGYSVYKSYSLFSFGSGAQPETKQLSLPILEAKAVKPVPEKVLADDDKIASGLPRELNMDKVKKMIKAGKLSDKEAEFYRKIE